MTSEPDRALAVVRRSQGDDNGAGLRLQREQVPELAKELADDIDILDLGVHTGFSILTRDEDAARIDSNPEVVDAIDRVRDGVYEVIVAWDDRRLARDDYFAEWRRAARLGGAEFAFIEDVEAVDSLTHGVRRTVETAVKQEEISKALTAIADRDSRNMWNSRPPTGLEFDDNRQYLVEGPQFDELLEALRLYQNGASYREIVEETRLSRGTIQRWVKSFDERIQSVIDENVRCRLLEVAPPESDEGGDAITKRGEIA